MTTWQFLQNQHPVQPCALLYVLNSEGSSPGRQGFKLALASDGSMNGSIGGGIMEFKLVELAKELLKKGETKILYKEQIHDKESPQNQSGMICSGRQEIAIIPLLEAQSQELEKLFQTLDRQEQGVLQLQPHGLLFEPAKKLSERFEYEFRNADNWVFREWIGFRNTVHIIGGGHVGAALSRQMALLGFHVIVYDNRDNLQTLEKNEHAHEKFILEYEKLSTIQTGSDSDYIVLMTFEYRTDKIALSQLLDKDFRYLGLMGSEAKVQKIFTELQLEGYTAETISKVQAPVGLPIFSKTPEEIAVSIAAQIIQVKNEELPTGRERG